MNFITDDVLAAIEKARPDLASWVEDKRHSMADTGKLDALRWVAFDLDAGNLRIACETLGILPGDIPALQRVLRVL